MDKKKLKNLIKIGFENVVNPKENIPRFVFQEWAEDLTNIIVDGNPEQRMLTINAVELTEESTKYTNDDFFNVLVHGIEVDDEGKFESLTAKLEVNLSLSRLVKIMNLKAVKDATFVEVQFAVKLMQFKRELEVLDYRKKLLNETITYKNEINKIFFNEENLKNIRII